MILIDSPVVIEFLKTEDPYIESLLYKHQAAICGVTVAEILHGAQDAADREELLEYLELFGQAALPDRIWSDVGDLLAAMRRKGLVIPFADAVIATLALDLDLELWTRDKHFLAVQSVFPELRLFDEAAN